MLARILIAGIQATFEVFDFAARICFACVIGCATARDAEPFLRVTIPSDFLVFHGEDSLYATKTADKQYPHESALTRLGRGECFHVFPVARVSGILLAGPSPMNEFKERIDGLCSKVIAAPDDSNELTIAMQELRMALRDHMEHLRRQIAESLEKGAPYANAQES